MPGREERLRGSVTWDPEAANTDAHRHLSREAGVGQHLPERCMVAGVRLSGREKAAKARQHGHEAGAHRPRARTLHRWGEARSSGAECLLEKETEWPGEKLGGDVQDRDLAYGECINSGLFS